MSETLLESALRLQRAGRLNEAADIYTQVLREQPRHFDALHALGIIRYQTGRLEEAERLIGEAAECQSERCERVLQPRLPAAPAQPAR